MRVLLGPGAITLGVSHDDPDVTPPEKCRYDIGVVVDEAFRAEEHVSLQTIPGAWIDMFAVWLPDSGYQPRSGPCFEWCHDVSADEVFRMDICVPVKPL